MTWKTRFLAVAFGAMSAALMAQQTTSAQTTTTTTQTVSGSVVQYSPGQTIVLRSADGRTTTYALGPNVQIPADVQVGRSVTISTQPGPNGSQAVVTRVETTTAGPGGQTKTTTERTEMSSPGQSGSSESSIQTSSPADAAAASISGKVTAYQPKQFITIEEPGKGTVTYVIDAQSELPQDIAVGKTVTITTRTEQGSSKPVVRTVTTTTRTTKTTTEAHPQ